MEKTNKYYSVIENLVKQNRKFQGLEAILDDIIDDVYSHSEVIINSINNDSVIQSYLEKVVSTSIITVPKKMGFHPEIKHRTIDAQQVLEKVAQRRTERVNTELVDRMINNIPIENKETPKETEESVAELAELKSEEPALMSENATQDQLSGDEVMSINEIQEDVQNNTPENFVTIDSLETEDLNEVEPTVATEDTHNSVLEDFVATDSLETEDLNEVEPTVATEDTHNSVLEDFVATDSLETEDLNEIEPTFETEELAQEESLEISDLKEEPNIVEDSKNDCLELNDLDEISLDDTTDDSTIDDVQGLALQETEEPVADNNIEGFAPSDESLEQTLDFDDLTPADNDFETLEPADTLDLDLQEDDNQTSLLDTELLEENPLDVINDNGLEQIADVITTTLENTETTSQEEINFKPTDYSVFSYSTDKYKDDIDAEEIVNEIKDLASKHPELNIINVYNLKFKEKLTIPQVASELDMSEDNVIEALNELVAIVQ